MKYLISIPLILFIGCQVPKQDTYAPMVLDTPISITSEKAPTPPRELAQEPEAPKAPAPVPVQRRTIVQYTIDSCGWCKYDRRNVLPKWVAKGWIWRDNGDHVIDETKNPKGAYPRYEIYDENGEKSIHQGSLLTWKP
jgi:hypothetical protein